MPTTMPVLPSAENYEQLIAASQPVPDAMVSREELAGIFYTGGTTGRSKGVMLSHANIVSNALHMLSEGLLPEGTVYLNAAPMFHLANGCGDVRFADRRRLQRRGADVQSGTGDADDRAGRRSRSTLIVPTMIQMLTDHPAVQDRGPVVAEAHPVRRLADQRGAARTARWRVCPAPRSISSTA